MWLLLGCTGCVYPRACVCVRPCPRACVRPCVTHSCYTDRDDPASTGRALLPELTTLLDTLARAMGRLSTNDDDNRIVSFTVDDKLETSPVTHDKFHRNAYNLLESQIHESSDAPPFAFGARHRGLLQTTLHLTE